MTDCFFDDLLTWNPGMEQNLIPFVPIIMVGFGRFEPSVGRILDIKRNWDFFLKHQCLFHVFSIKIILIYKLFIYKLFINY